MKGIPHLEDRERHESLQTNVQRLLDGPAAPLGHRPGVVLGRGVDGSRALVGVHAASNRGVYIRRFC